MADGFSLYGNSLKASYVKRARRWQQMFIDKFSYDPDEQYELTLFENEYLGSIRRRASSVRPFVWDTGTTESQWQVRRVRGRWATRPTGLTCWPSRASHQM